jgi:hypothetical protein
MLPDPCPSPVPQLLLNSRQAALALSVSERTLWSLTQPRGPVPVVRIGLPGSKKPAVRYSVSDLERFIAEQKEHQLRVVT